MKTLVKASLAAAATIGLSACSTLGEDSGYGISSYTPIQVKRVSVGDGKLSVAPPRPWNRQRAQYFYDVAAVEDWTLNGPYLDGISFVSGLKNNKTLLYQRRSDNQQVPPFRSNMSLLTVALRSSAALTALVAAAAQAQPESTLPPPDVQNAQASTSNERTAQGEIVITGSRIRRDPLSQDSPVTFVDQSDIQKTGLNSVNEVLQRLPSAAGGLNGKVNLSGNAGNPPNGQGVGAGAADVDLRYLGSQRTLVLVDGLRFVPGASASGVPGAVDVNSIPESMKEGRLVR